MINISNLSISEEPGIYLMKDKEGKILYIGKAKNLKKRVKTYFLKNQDYKTQKLVEKISDIEFILTDNESEAYLLESNMIKQYRPIYNIELKDQQRYTYLRITDEKFPRLLVTRRTRTGKFLGKGKVFGPFTQGSSKLLTIGALRKTFKIRICKRLPKKVCLEYHLGNCEGPCELEEAQDRYSQYISDLETILKGKKHMKDFEEKLESEMQNASKYLHFERAKDIRDTLQRLRSLDSNQKMENPRRSDEEYFGIMVKNQKATIMTFRQTHGVIKDSEKFSFDLIADNSFSNFLYQYYTTHKIPKFIVTNTLPEKKATLELLLTEKARFVVKFVVPKHGTRKQLISLIMRNISLIQAKDSDPALLDLQEQLSLSSLPRVIECFDISNHGEQYAVGSMSRFLDGEPNKSGYRKFKIRSVIGRDDFAMINEIVKRRYMRLKEQDDDFPDLVLIDGGKGQLSSALKALQSLNVKISCISLAKENEEIFIPNKLTSIRIPKNKPSLKILQYARDEAHRFGVKYNRQLRSIQN